MSDDTLELGTQLAVTERGSRLDNFSEEDVNLALRLLVLVGGNTSKAVRGLAEQDLLIKHDQLRYWRDTAFPRRYADIRAELAQDQNEKVAGNAMDLAEKAHEAESEYLDAALSKIDEVNPDRLAAAARDLARASAENVNQAQLLRNKPTQIVETRDTNELLEQLVKLGIVERDPRTVAPAIPARAKPVDALSVEFEQSATPRKRTRPKPGPSEDDEIEAEMMGEV